MTSDQTLVTKRCRVCGESKPATTANFQPIQGGKYLNSYCRPCAKVLRRAQYESGGREAMKAEAERRASEGLCVKCGVAPPIEGRRACESCRTKGRKSTAASRQKRLLRPGAQDETLARQRQYYLENPERFAEYRRRRRPADQLAEPGWRLRKYGLTVAERDAQLERQGGRCAICRTDLTKKRLTIDHCHDTNMLRGILCSNCNVGLGMFDHSARRLQAAIRYLKSHAWGVAGV